MSDVRLLAAGDGLWLMRSAQQEGFEFWAEVGTVRVQCQTRTAPTREQAVKIARRKAARVQ
jgi:hypothetical protein